ncbi:hypothetical protein JCM1841_005882 [Sporobolomyces salmonicolor]
MVPSSFAATATAALALLSIASSSSASPLLWERNNGLASCLRSDGIRTVTTYSAAYSQDSAAYNQRIQPKPAALVYPSTPSQISSALLCAAKTNTSVSARGGGHSYASYGLGGADGALVIDLSGFQNVTVSEEGVASIGAGQRLGDVALALNEQGWALSHGTCPFVGIGGHASYGGFGFAARMWGLTLDAVAAYDVVLANGTILTNVTRTSSEDLFWALNGAAPSYAIITTYHFTALHAPATAVIFSYSYSNSPSVVTAATAFNSFASFGNESAPANLGLQATIGADSLTINGVWYGPRAEFDGVIEPLTNELPPGYSSSVETYSWIESLEQLANGEALNTTGHTEGRDDFYTMSLMTPSTVPISIDVLERYFNYLVTSNTTTNWFVQADLYGGSNSQINAVSLSDSSFGHRDKLLTFQMYASSPTYGQPYPEDGVSFVQGMYDTIVDGMTSIGAWSNKSTDPNGYAAYINYVDPLLTPSEVRNLYWGAQYPRLQTVKEEYDPNQVLRNPQSIVPA